LYNLDDSLIVAISDTGVGISQVDIPNLFNKFKQFRATAVNKERKGTGLGLVISKGIIEGHGGVISVSSVEGSGTTSIFTLPLK
jgi:signal transduction histidine kinase